MLFLFLLLLLLLYKPVGFWFVSLLWGLVCSLPHTLGTTSSNPGSPVTLAVGGTIYLLGLVTESMADYQKWSFKGINTNSGRFCNVGLWSVTQHPNFFGNLLLWVGILIMNSDALVDVNAATSAAAAATATGADGVWATLWGARRLVVACLSPLFMWLLFSGQANGTMMNSVELANERYGADPKFREYVEGVPTLVPNLVPWLKELFGGLLRGGKY